jgi:hypothetical protein
VNPLPPHTVTISASTQPIAHQPAAAKALFHAYSGPRDGDQMRCSRLSRSRVPVLSVACFFLDYLLHRQGMDKEKTGMAWLGVTGIPPGTRPEENRHAERLRRDEVEVATASTGPSESCWHLQLGVRESDDWGTELFGHAADECPAPPGAAKLQGRPWRAQCRDQWRRCKHASPWGMACPRLLMRAVR